MNNYDLILIAFSLTSSAFSLAIVSSVQRCLSVFEKIRLIALFALIPALMSWIGYWVGVPLKLLLNWENEWIFIILLLIIGTRMILRSNKVSPENRTYHYGEFRVIFVLSIALGLQAFIIGTGFAFTEIAIHFFLLFFVVFGIVINFLGILIGKRSGNFQWGNKIHFLGGVLMVGLAIKQLGFLLGII